MTTDDKVASPPEGVVAREMVRAMARRRLALRLGSIVATTSYFAMLVGMRFDPSSSYWVTIEKQLARHNLAQIASISKT